MKNDRTILLPTSPSSAAAEGHFYNDGSAKPTNTSTMALAQAAEKARRTMALAQAAEKARRG